MPSTPFLATNIASHLFSIALNVAHVSVVKYGFPVPPPTEYHYDGADMDLSTSKSNWSKGN